MAALVNVDRLEWVDCRRVNTDADHFIAWSG
jgi:hypothetical protein